MCYKRHYGTTLLILMATRFSLSRSILMQPICTIKRPHINSHSLSYPKQLLKSHSCPLRSSSISICLLHFHSHNKSSRNSTTAVRSYSSSTATRMSTPVEGTENNPLLKEFYFPPFDSIKPDHVRSGIVALLKQLVRVEML